MKRITCEMCGSVDLVKDGGLFVCQHCGCKYTVEEARKLMIEGNVNVVVDKTQEVENTLTYANRELSDGNLESAVRAYEQILSIDPDNVVAMFNKQIASKRLEFIKTHDDELKLSDSPRIYERVFQLAHEKYGDSKEYFELCGTMMITMAVHLLNPVFDEYIAAYNKFVKYTISPLKILVKNTILCNHARDVCDCNIQVLDFVTKYPVSYEEASIDFWQHLQTINSNTLIYCKRVTILKTPQEYIDHDAKIKALMQSNSKHIANAKKRG